MTNVAARQRDTAVNAFVRILRQRWWWLAAKREASMWDGGLPAPAPIKQGVVKEYGRKYGARTLVETGTFRGDMVAAARSSFDQVHTIELSSTFAQFARKRFRRANNVHIHEGDSATVLADVLELVNTPAVIWLDAHYSEGGTARGESETPVEQELSVVLTHPQARVVLIDDARLFGTGDYPPLDRVRELATEAGRSFEIALDIIRIV